MTKADECNNETGDAVPHRLHQWLEPFRCGFTAPTWSHLLVLVMGALLAPGKRTVTSCLRITGRADVTSFATYHQFLNRARWNPRLLARHLLSIVVTRLVPEGPVVIGMDDTIEAMASAYCCSRYIPRPDTFQPWSFRQGQWIAVAEFYGSFTSPLGQMHQSNACADNPVPFRTI